MNRHDKIRTQLQYLEDVGVIERWEARPGKTWLVYDPHIMLFSTREVERYIWGAEAAIKRLRGT